MGTPVLCGISVTYHPAEVTFPTLPQPNKAGSVDLATPESCRAGLS